MQPELRALEQALAALRRHSVLGRAVDRRGRIQFGTLALEDIAALLGDPAASLLLLAAADLNRTALRARTEALDAQLVAPTLRRAFVVQSQLPSEADFTTVVELALQRRAGTLGRNANAATETLFRLDLPSLLSEAERDAARQTLREQISAARPRVVALLICRAEELEVARRYQPRAEAFIDRLFFADEIPECLSYLAAIVEGDPA